MPVQNKKIDWDTLLYAIEHEDCVLFIGPEVARTKEGKLFHNALYDLMGPDNQKHYYFSQDELFVTETRHRTAILSKVDSFLQGSFNQELYSRLAFIPFHLIVSTSPDLFLKQIFEANNIYHEYHYYNYSKVQPVDISEPARNHPVLYNMVGSTEDSGSMIITYKDLYSYLKGILGNKPLPTDLLNELKNVTRFIFLGFKFDIWYVQLLLALLYDEVDKENNEGLAPAINLPPEADEICSRQFNICFVETNIEKFTEELYSRCEKAGLLRQPGKEEDLVSKRAYSLVKQDNIREAIDLLFDFFEDADQEIYNHIAGISGRFNRTKRRLNEGVMDQKDADIELNKVNKGLLDLIEEVKTQEAGVTP